ncbi:hypothetical protein [Marilutibacter aestuarii]|uniref:WxL domain-containing protein n=1 Tax=Marilutibacter aestuarii TaxID=1706195 RepID=A0A508AN35_9GAMM|nr:hypothetical protein [Lysobacter aestuarii]TQD51366.1 hypothetical protein FKV25_01445 [Lysobacter aestuarii]
MNVKHSLLAAALFAAALPLAVQAESNTVSSGNATARLDFQITVPRILMLRVGTDDNVVNLIDFNVTAAQLQTLGTPVAATAASGNVGNGTVTATVKGNNGQISLRADSVGALSNGSGDSISYGQITTTSSAPAALPAPVLADGTGTAVNVPLSSGKITNATAQWTYSYKNDAMVAPGTYGGVNTKNSRVTYTASMP